MKRTFIAIRTELSPEYDLLRSELRRRTHYDEITWVEEGLQHTTLRFIGKTPEDKIALIKEMLANISSGIHPFELKINKLGVFGSRYCPRVIWLGFEKHPILDQIHNQINEGLASMGFEPIKENFVPHITLGRIRKVDDKRKFFQLIEELQPTYKQVFKPEGITFYRSQLESSGPIYTVLSEAQFNPKNS